MTALAVGVSLVVAAVVVWAALTYNRLVGDRNRIREAWAGIDVQLQRRADLVPNLVETVEGFRMHERDVVVGVTRARADVVDARGPAASGLADDRLEGQLQRLFAVAEAYPDLKTSEQFLSLQRQLVALEEEISFARRYYNALVQRANTRMQRVPAVAIAGALGFEQQEYFKAGPAERAVPSAELDG